MNAAMVTSAADLWVRGPVTTAQRPAETAPREIPAVAPPRERLQPPPRRSPGPPVAPQPTAHQSLPGVSWLGAHGGAGTTTLAEQLGGRDLGTHWPDLGSGDFGRFLVVARTNAAGLRAASQVLDALRTGNHPAGVELLALVLVADAPGRLPLSLARRIRVLRSVADTVRVPWIPGWRTGQPVHKPPKELAKLADLVDSWSRA